jgi:ABC-type multidrug transport system ATPase subunit
MRTFRSSIGYVAKETILYDQFSVREAIRFESFKKKPLRTYKFTMKKIDSILQALNIEWFANKHIGIHGEPLSLSSTQRRLIDIGQELSGEPSALVLDSPLNNVSFSKQIQIVQSLRTISKSGVTVIALLDNPRYEIMCSFDDLILFGKGGKVIYNGPTKDCLDYFLEVGFKCPKHINPADLFQDIIEGNVERPGDHEFSKDKLTEIWHSKKLESDKPWSLFKDGVNQDDKMDEKKKKFMEKHNKKKTPKKILKKITKDNRVLKFFGQYLLFTYRSSIQLFYHLNSLFLEILVTFLTASLIGGLFLNMAFVGPLDPSLQSQCPDFMVGPCSAPRANNIPIISLASLIGFSIVSMLTCDKVFGHDKKEYKKEVRSGINKLAYFLGKLTSHIPSNLIISLLYITILFFFIAPRANFGFYFLIFLLINFVWTGFGYIVTISMSKEHSLFFGGLFILLSTVLSGFSPTLTVLETGLVGNTTTYLTAPLVSLSPMRYSLELMYATELSFYESEKVNTATAYATYGFRNTTIWLDVLMLVFFGFFFRIIAFIILYFQDPKFQAYLIYILSNLFL